eukprot:SAG22_NODE_311_length_12629_cov_20.911891_1_plen_628_part_10
MAAREKKRKRSPVPPNRASPPPLSVEEWQTAFQDFDRDGDGEVSWAELHVMLKNKGFRLSPREIDTMFSGADTDGDQKVTFDEFKKMFGADSCPLARRFWHDAVAAAVANYERELFEPLERQRVRRAAQYRYDDRKSKWSTCTIEVQIQDRPFRSGNMRRCFAMRARTVKSNGKTTGWKRYVAKKYTRGARASDEYLPSNTEGFPECPRGRVPLSEAAEAEWMQLCVDVQMQSRVRTIADAFNRKDPPKKVGFLEGTAIGPVPGAGRGGAAAAHSNSTPGTIDGTYFVEAFIDGAYIKHNNNSGYVGMDHMSGRQQPTADRSPVAPGDPTRITSSDSPDTGASGVAGGGTSENTSSNSSASSARGMAVVGTKQMRMTPHALSYFSWHYTEGKEMLCDVQGVEDLYTDPQMHSVEGLEYGEGNLGLDGMELFLTSHVPGNPIEAKLGLPAFHLSPSEEHFALKDMDWHGPYRGTIKSTELAGEDEAGGSGRPGPAQLRRTRLGSVQQQQVHDVMIQHPPLAAERAGVQRMHAEMHCRMCLHCVFLCSTPAFPGKEYADRLIYRKETHKMHADQARLGAQHHLGFAVVLLRLLVQRLDLRRNSRRGRGAGRGAGLGLGGEAAAAAAAAAA